MVANPSIWMLFPDIIRMVFDPDELLGVAPGGVRYHGDAEVLPRNGHHLDAQVFVLEGLFGDAVAPDEVCRSWFRKGLLQK